MSATRPIHKFDHLHPTKRGWLFLGRMGGPCDMQCKHCYYAFQNQLVFFSLDTLMAHANLYRHHYGLEYCDMSGGEATIYGPKVDGRRPDLERLVKHCAEIGLKPTIITHGQNNTPELVSGVEDAGLEDWLISMHGMRQGHDDLVVKHNKQGAGGWEKLTGNLKNCKRPIRFNTTLQSYNYHEMPDQAKWLSDNMPATVWNMIQFNPFYAWAGKEVIEFQSKMSDMAPFIGEAVKTAEAAGWEVNVRYFPYCVAAEHGFARNCVNFYGTQYDPWEWALDATNRMPMAAIKQLGGFEGARRAHCDRIAEDRNNEVCSSCRFHKICESVPRQYQARFGLDELAPMAGEPITDIAYFEKGGSWQ